MGGPSPRGTVTASDLEKIGLNPDQIAAIGDGTRSTYGPGGFMSREEMQALGLTPQQMFQVEAAAGYGYNPGGMGMGGPGGGYVGGPVPAPGADGRWYGDIARMPTGVHVDQNNQVIGADGSVLGEWAGGYSGGGPGGRMMPDGPPETWSTAQQQEFGYNPETRTFADDPTARGHIGGGGGEDHSRIVDDWDRTGGPGGWYGGDRWDDVDPGWDMTRWDKVHDR
jgi:hypothetical protein